MTFLFNVKMRMLLNELKSKNLLDIHVFIFCVQ